MSSLLSSRSSIVLRLRLDCERRRAAARVTAVSPEGCRVELLELIFRHYRPDLDGLYSAVSEDDDVRPFGFACYLRLWPRAFSRRAG